MKVFFTLHLPTELSTLDRRRRRFVRSGVRGRLQLLEIQPHDVTQRRSMFLGYELAPFLYFFSEVAQRVHYLQILPEAAALVVLLGAQRRVPKVPEEQATLFIERFFGRSLEHRDMIG